MSIVYLEQYREAEKNPAACGVAQDSENGHDSSETRVVELAPGLWFDRGGMQVCVIGGKDSDNGSGLTQPIRLYCVYSPCFFGADPDDDPDPAAPAQAAWCQLQTSLSLIARQATVPQKPARPARGRTSLSCRVPLSAPDRTLPTVVLPPPVDGAGSALEEEGEGEDEASERQSERFRRRVALGDCHRRCESAALATS